MTYPAEEPSALPSLLGPGDPPPVELWNSAGSSPALLIADHAGSAIPARLGSLGLPPAARALHIAHDIGIADLTRALADRLDAAALLGRYSRLVIDGNRRLDDPTSIAQESDSVVVPGNRGLAAADRRARAEAVFAPYHAAIAAGLAERGRTGRRTALVSMHSFTPRMGGVARPWHLGVLWDKDGRMAQPLLAALRAEPDLVIGENEPYDARTGEGYTLDAHATPIGLPHVLIEVRQDLIDERGKAAALAERLARILEPIVEETARG
ncbi:MAG: N-formylglutamate amidohydrolase [Dongiaceae bacterium]